MADCYWTLIITAQRAGQAALPTDLGLEPPALSALYHQLGMGSLPQRDGRDELRHQLLAARLPLRDELEQLLLRYAADRPDSRWMARVVATAALAGSHLWRDLGMPDRPTLRALIGDYFPPLIALNHLNLRWKKFLFRLLCADHGDQLCPAPDCASCSEFDHCRDESLPSTATVASR